MSLVENTNLLFTELSKPNPDIEFIHIFIDLGIDPLQVDNDGYTLLMIYLIHSDCPDPTIITILVNAGVKIEARNTVYSNVNSSKNRTALLYAACNKNSSLEVFQTLYKLGATYNDSYISNRYSWNSYSYDHDVIHLYCKAKYSSKCNNYHHQHPDDLIYQYLIQVKRDQNTENTQVNGLYLHKVLENYIIETDDPDPLEISKIIQSYSHIPGIYPTNCDVSMDAAEKYSSKLISGSLFQVIKVFFIAAAKRCSIEVFQTLIFEYGIDMAERFGSNLLDILAGNYCLKSNESHQVENLLSSYIYSKDINHGHFHNRITCDFGDSLDPFCKISHSFDRRFNIDTFKYLVNIVNLNYGLDQLDAFNVSMYDYKMAKHPFLTISSSFYYIQDSDYELSDIISILLDSDVKKNIIDQKRNNVIMNYILYMNENYRYFNISNYIKIITILLKAGIDVNYQNTWENNETALMYVANRGRSTDVRIFKTLIEYGADVNCVGKDGSTVLSKCLTGYSLNPDYYFSQHYYFSLNVIKYIVSQVDFTTCLDKITLYLQLYCKMDEHDIDVLNILLFHGPDVNDIDEFGYDCLSLYLKCAKYPDISIIIRLIEYGVDMSYTNKKEDHRTHLSYVIMHCFSEDIIECLINYGTIDNIRRTFIQLCKFEKRHDDIENLPDNYLTELNDRFKYLSTYFYSSSTGTTDDTEEYKKQVKKAKLETDEICVDIHGDELLEYCGTLFVNAEVLNIILNFKNIDVNRVDLHNDTALMLLALYNTLTPEIISMLVNANININYKNRQGRTVMHYVCKENLSKSIYDSLIEHGFDVTLVSQWEKDMINNYLKS